MKLWEALKIHGETGRKIKPQGGSQFMVPSFWTMNVDALWEVEPVPLMVSKEELQLAWNIVTENPENHFAPSHQLFLEFYSYLERLKQK